MNDLDILRAAITKALDLGWKPDRVEVMTYNVKNITASDGYVTINWLIGLDTIDRLTLDIRRFDIYRLLFSHDFARAVWGSRSREMYDLDFAWEHHLKQMVMSEAPIRYLADHLPSEAKS